MARKPTADMDDLAISKGAAAQAVPFKGTEEPAVAAGQPKGLTIKLDAPLYAELRRYCFKMEQASGTRVTHQAVMVQALREMLERERNRTP